MIRTIVAALPFVFAATLIHAQDFSPEELSRRTIERRAVEVSEMGICH